MLKPEFQHVDSRVGIAVPAKPEQAAGVDLGAVRKIIQVEIVNALQNAEHLVGSQGPAGPQGQPGETGRTGLQGPQGQPGKDGATLEEIRVVVRSEVASALNAAAKSGLFRGRDGATGATGPQGVQGESGQQGVPGVTGPQGSKGDSGERGEQGAKGDQGAPGKDGNNPLSLEQISQFVNDKVLAVLGSEVSKDIAAAHHVQIKKALVEIEKEADTRPSLRPIYSSMVERIRRILN